MEFRRVLFRSVLALLVPFGTGTGFIAMLAVIFLVRLLHQVSQPAEAAAAPLVASHAELASANSFLSLASSTGEVTGKALLAPAVALGRASARDGVFQYVSSWGVAD